MEEYKFILIIIYLTGVIVNLFSVEYIIPIEENKSGGGLFEIFAFLFVLPILMLMYLFRIIFITSSWIGLIIYGIIWIYNKIWKQEQLR